VVKGNVGEPSDGVRSEISLSGGLVLVGVAASPSVVSVLCLSNVCKWGARS